MAQSWWFYQNKRERCWRATFHGFFFSGSKKSSVKQTPNGEAKSEERCTSIRWNWVGVGGLQISKPQTQKAILQSGLNRNGIEETFETSAGINLEAPMGITEGKLRMQSLLA